MLVLPTWATFGNTSRFSTIVLSNLSRYALSEKIFCKKVLTIFFSFQKATTALFSFKSDPMMVSDIQEVYRTYNGCFSFIAVLQAQFVCTKDPPKLQAELKKVLENILPLELDAHSSCSIFYYRYNYFKDNIYEILNFYFYQNGIWRGMDEREH